MSCKTTTRYSTYHLKQMTETQFNNLSLRQKGSFRPVFLKNQITTEESDLTDSESVQETLGLEMENEILAEQIRDRLFSYRISKENHLESRKKVCRDMEICKSEFGGIRNSVQDALSGMRNARRGLKGFNYSLHQTENYDCAGFRDVKRYVRDQLFDIQQQIKIMNKRISDFDEQFN